MLTEEQLKNLEPLTKHKKYGPIVKAAIIGWKRCRPTTETFGVDRKNSKFVRDLSVKGCCFLGAAVLNRKSSNEGWVVWDIMKKFNLSFLSECWSLSDGFENENAESAHKEAYNFGKKVRKALGI